MFIISSDRDGAQYDVVSLAALVGCKVFAVTFCYTVPATEWSILGLGLPSAAK